MVLQLHRMLFFFSFSGDGEEVAQQIVTNILKLRDAVILLTGERFYRYVLFPLSFCTTSPLSPRSSPLLVWLFVLFIESFLPSGLCDSCS